ncbi:hypothetical protein F5Y17DRAFT_441631 [Xylariaceae sp. FL0594]|nr:hypothetical protein F5Y17DRAFT_441631 [Xylariaceae sp. FL0594]
MARDYVPVAQDGSEMGEKDLYLTIQRTHLESRWRRFSAILGVALVLSLSSNIFFAYKQMVRPWELLHELPTRYAGLRREVPTEILAHTDYDSVNRTIQDAAWGHVDVEPWNGFVALDEDYAMGVGLPHSQRWPWDLSKGVYILSSSHELHCVHVLRELVNDDHDGVPEAERKWHYPHLMHCLNVLRESVMCNADDTPLYIGRLHKNVHEKSPRAGTGTVKMCRDWGRLLAWSRDRSACYRPVEPEKEGRLGEIERYKSCPDGARPWEDVQSMV